MYKLFRFLLLDVSQESIAIMVEPPRYYQKHPHILSQLDRLRLTTFVTMCLSCFVMGVFYSILGPFFPQEVTYKTLPIDFLQL